MWDGRRPIKALSVFSVFILSYIVSQIGIRPLWSQNSFIGHHSFVSLLAMLPPIFSCVVINRCLFGIFTLDPPVRSRGALYNCGKMLDSILPVAMICVVLLVNGLPGIITPAVFLRFLLFPVSKKVQTKYCMYLKLIKSHFRVG